MLLDVLFEADFDVTEAADATLFLRAAVEKIGQGFHTDSSAYDYTENDGSKLFPSIVATWYDSKMAQCSSILDSTDMYDWPLHIMRCMSGAKNETIDNLSTWAVASLIDCKLMSVVRDDSINGGVYTRQYGDMAGQWTVQTSSMMRRYMPDGTVKDDALLQMRRFGDFKQLQITHSQLKAAVNAGIGYTLYYGE